MFAALNISEGIVRDCPIKDIFGIGQDDSQDKDQEGSSFQEPIIPYSHL